MQGGGHKRHKWQRDENVKPRGRGVVACSLRCKNATKPRLKKMAGSDARKRKERWMRLPLSSRHSCQARKDRSSGRLFFLFAYRAAWLASPITTRRGDGFQDGGSSSFWCHGGGMVFPWEGGKGNLRCSGRAKQRTFGGCAACVQHASALFDRYDGDSVLPEGTVWGVHITGSHSRIPSDIAPIAGRVEPAQCASKDHPTPWSSNWPLGAGAADCN